MGRVINPESAGKERKALSKAIVLALRELAGQQDTGAQAHDLAAFIVLALATIQAGIDVSVLAWEKRGYWVKADRFRMEWMWTDQLGRKMQAELLQEDWPAIAGTMMKIAEKLKGVDVPQHNRIGTPWVGAWKQLLSKLPQA